MISDLLNNKRVLILGFGREGKSTLEFIKNHTHGVCVGIADLNEIQIDGIATYCGDNYQRAIYDYDIVMKSPGVVLGALPPEQLKKINSQTELFLQQYGERVIGVTGTKGKSTTASLIYHILNDHLPDVFFAGNIGVPIFDVIDSIKDDSYIVFELSCHQLEYTDFSPKIGMILNLFEEHLDHYGTYEKYINAKKNIFRHQKRGDMFFYDYGNPEIDNNEFNIDGREVCTAAYGKKDAVVYADDEKFIFKDTVLKINPDEIPLKGTHNLYNAAIAFAVCLTLGIKKEDFYSSLLTFTPLTHRMEKVGTYDGVTYYNDSISTIPAAAIKAIESIKNVSTVLIGGMDRGINYDTLTDFLANCDVKNIILMPDTGTRIYPTLKDCGKNVVMAKTLSDAVTLAKTLTPKNSVCLLSPAAPSYGFFKNFEERGNKFKELITK